MNSEIIRKTDDCGIFECLRRMIEKENIVLVIDEFPDLVSASPMVASLMQEFVDRHLQGTGSFLIVLICGRRVFSPFREREYRRIPARAP